MQYPQRKLISNRSSFKLVNQVVFQHFYSTNKSFDAGQPTPATHPKLLKEDEITPGITCDEYISRRKRILELLPEQSVAIFAAAPVKMMTDVVPYPFRQDADYLYITGCHQPGGVAVLGHDFGLVMFMPQLSTNEITWQGQLAGVDAATEYFKANMSYPISKLPMVLPNMIKNCSKVYHNVKTATPDYTDLETFKKIAYNGRVDDFSKYTHEARWVKSSAELNLMRESAAIGCQALLQTMLQSKISPYENILSSKVEYECRIRGAQRMSFYPVVGGGANGTVIHYSRNDQKVNDGDLLVMDLGCELHGYVSDLTRTWPPCGSFSDVHKEVYDLILETNKECIELCEPGTSIQRIQNYSVGKLARGLKEIGILKDNLLNSYLQLNPTNIGHYLGMDVHDCGKIGYERTLKPGVVLTIEPGVYIPLNHNCAQRYQGLGIRIEDEVLITETGHEVLTGSLPKEINHIETLLNHHT